MIFGSMQLLLTTTLLRMTTDDLTENPGKSTLIGLYIVINIRPMVNYYLWPGYLLYTTSDYRT